MTDRKNKTQHTLRGGGCGLPNRQQPTNIQQILRKIIEVQLKEVQLKEVQVIDNFYKDLRFHVNQICTKASAAANQSESQEIMISIQWLVFQEEQIYKLSKNAQINTKSYDQIVEAIRNLLNTCLIYIKTDQFKCFYILQITASLSKVLFSFHIINNERFIDQFLRKEFLDICDKLQRQIEIEKNDLIQFQMELYLFLTKTSFYIAPSNEGNDFYKGCLRDLVFSIVNMQPCTQLLQTLCQSAQKLYRFYGLKQNRKQYEVYFQIDMLQWEIISYFKNDEQQNLVDILEKIEEIHVQLVKNSNNWKNHFLWIQMIGKILIYNPLLTKQDLGVIKFQAQESYKNNFLIKEKAYEQYNELWNELQNQGKLIQMNHCDDQALVLLNQFEKIQLDQLDILILQRCFKGWENFLLLKEYLMNEQNQNIHFTFYSYSQCKLKLGTIEPQKDEQNLAAGEISRFIDFIIPNKLIILIKENYEKQGMIVRNYRHFMKCNQYLNQKIQQKSRKAEITKMILNFKEYFKNTQNIRKIIRLCSRRQNFQIEQFEQLSELNNCQQLKYLMKALQQLLTLQIQEFKDKMDDYYYSEQVKNDEFKVRGKILLELTELKLNNSQLDDLRKKLLDEFSASICSKNYLKTTQKLIKIITTSWKQLEKIENQEITSLQNENHLILFFENQLNNLSILYDEISQKNDDNQLMVCCLKEIIQIKYEIETLLNIQHPQELVRLIADIQILNIEEIKFHKQLKIIKKSLKNILAQADPQQLKNLQEFINLDEFLLSVIKDFPKRIICYNSDNEEQTIAQLANVQFTEKDYENKLSKQKGLIEYLQFDLSGKEQIISSEESDLQLIEKELGELFLEESPEQSLIQIIESLSLNELQNYVIDEKFNLSKQRQEIEKIENFLFKLRKIKDSSNHYKIDLIAHQTETVIKTLETFGKRDKDIFLILMQAELKKLKSIVSQYQDENAEKQKFSQIEKNILIVNENDKMLENNDNQFKQNGKDCSYEKSIPYLKCIIKILQLQKLKIQEQKKQLNKFLEEISHFSNDDLQQIQRQTQETKTQCYEIFECRFKKFITKFKQITMTNINLEQKENENFELYFERILIDIYVETNTGNTKTQTNIADFLNKKKLYFQGKLINQKYFLKTSIKQEVLIQQVTKLFLEDQDEENDEKSHQELGLIEALNEKFKDLTNNEEWRIKQGLVFTIIQISSHCFTDSIRSVCQTNLIQLWVSEKDQKVRNVLKNENLIIMQMQILRKDWQTQHDRISGEMQYMLQRIDQFQKQIFHEANLNKRDLQLEEMNEMTKQLDEYIENVSEMGQQLRLITDFVNHIRKGLLRLEQKINEIKEQLNSIGNDIKFLRGKSVEQLFEIRKWKVLKEAAQKNIKSIYVPLKTKEKGKNEERYLMNLEQFDDKVGEVNEFLQEENKTVLLIHGIAGSGKSTTAKKIEEFTWKQHGINKIRNQILIPVYISLPSLKNPVFQAVEETLRQDDFGFDDLQLKECKEKLIKKEFRFLLIMDSYDEMKLENIQKNIYLSNKVKQNWSDPLVIITTRSEIFTSSNYNDWFAPEVKENLKEIELRKFAKEQKHEYLKQFTIQKIKTLIFELYEWQLQTQNQKTIDINKFESFWGKLQSSFYKLKGQQLNSEVLLNQKQIESILQFLKDNEFFALKSNEAIRNLSINLKQLWSIEKYDNMMKQINLETLVETPYMMEIIVKVLPEMMVKASDINMKKQHFIKNFSIMFKDFFKSQFLIQMYKRQKKQHLIQLTNETEKKSHQDTFVNQDEQLEITKTDVQKLETIDYGEVSLQIWNQMEINLIPKLQVSKEFDELKNMIFQKIEPNLLNNSLNQIYIRKESIASLIYDALNTQNLTPFDFYSEFINYYHLKQIEKLKNLGKSINIESFSHDIQQYSIKLAKTMSQKQLTQVQYKQKGLLFKEQGVEEKLFNQFFDDDVRNGSYKKDIRSCSLVQKKGANFSFVHKSIQEFLIAFDLYEKLVLSQDIDLPILSFLIGRLSKQQMQNKDVFEFLDNLCPSKLDIKLENLSFFQRQEYLNEISKNIELVKNVIKIIKKHEFNKINFSTEIYIETRKYLIQKISQELKIIEFLKFLVHLTKIDTNLIQGGSNALNLLIEMKVNLTKQDFSHIKIKNSSLVGANFSQCIFNGSELENVILNGINLNGAQLLNCKWKSLKINELFELSGHRQRVTSFCYSPDGSTLASGGEDNCIRLWDIKTGLEKNKLDGHTGSVYSVSFSLDGTTLASGSEDNSIRLWDVETGLEKAQLLGLSCVNSVSFSPDGTTLASGSDDSPIRLWDVKTGLETAQLDGHEGGVYSVCFSPDRTTLASGGWDNQIRLWDFLKRLQKNNLYGHSDSVHSLSFSPDGFTLASGSFDFSIRLWDVQKGLEKAKLDGHFNGVQSVSFSPDGITLATGAEDNSIRLWDVQTGLKKAQLDSHSKRVFSVCFSPDGTTLASGSWDNSIRLWDVKTGSNQAKLHGHSSSVLSVCFSPDGSTLASGGEDNSIRLWDVKTGLEKALLHGHTRKVLSVCFSPDGTALASGSEDYSILLWDVKTGSNQAKLHGHNSSVLSVCFSPDGTNLASGGEDNSIRLWDVKTGLEKTQLHGHTCKVLSVCFSPDGTTLASGSEDNSIRLWDIKTGSLRAQSDGHIYGVQSVSFSPDGTTLAFGCGKNSIRLWDVRTQQEKAKLDGHTHRVYSISFSPDGTTLASGSLDNSILLWDVKTGSNQAKLQGHFDTVCSVSFSPDGTILASGSRDNSIRLWDLKIMLQKAQMEDHNDTFSSVCFSPDGTTLATGSDANFIRLWDVKTGKLIEPQNQQYKDNLEKFQTPIFQNNAGPKVNTIVTILRISQTPLFQAQGTLILKGEFKNHKDVDLKLLFAQRGSCILDK